MNNKAVLKENLIVVIVPQEYKDANHKYLWHCFARSNKTDVLILDISADFLVTLLFKKWYRIKEHKQGLIELGENIKKYRPFFAVRPEIMPRRFSFLVRNALKNQLKKYYCIDRYNVKFLVYDPKWVRILKGFSDRTQIYYFILDELKLYAHNDSEIRRNVIADQFACKHCDYIFAMTEQIKLNRIEYIEKTTVIGNGSISNCLKKNGPQINASVGFIGVFRNWIDDRLLIELISYRKDLLFCFVGPIEPDMREIMRMLLNSFNNTAYFGIAQKEEVIAYYKMFDVVVVPYKQNDFMYATRPIKIVESVFAGTPVVSIPMSGYKECSFIKYATSYMEFSNKIDELMEYPIDTLSQEYQNFIKENSWDTKSDIICRIMGTDL